MTNRKTKGNSNRSAVQPRFRSTKLAAAAMRCALILAVLCVVMLLASVPAQAQIETVLYGFTGGSDGGYAESSLTFDKAGNLYGTSWLNCGNVFELSPNGGGGWSEKVLYQFTCGADGGDTNDSTVIFDSHGNIYGTAAIGGIYGFGVVFELSPVGGSWVETVLYNFANTGDGCYPQTGVIMDSAGNLYGTAPGDAVVFELTPSKSGWKEKVIYDQVSGSSYGGLTMDASGNIYGTGYLNNNESVAFEVTPSGKDDWNGKMIYAFPCNAQGKCPRGTVALGTLVFDQAGNLYGTAMNGGGKNDGTLFELSLVNGKWTGRTVHTFAGNPKDGADPFGGVVFDAAGNMYGTTRNGGNYGDWGDCGAVYEVPNGGREKVLWNFDCTNGGNPEGSLILDNAGNLYGTAYGGAGYSGGNAGYGVVFELTPVTPATTTTLTSSPNPSTHGEPVTFTAVVTSSAGVPPDGETVKFEHGKTVLGTGALSGGSASFTTSTLKVGSTVVTAVYGGDPDFGGSTSNPVTQVVEKAGK